MTQEERVLQYIAEKGSITPIEAFTELGITKLATVVSRLIHKQGYAIRKEYASGKNRFGEKVCFMRYTMPEKEG